MEKESLYIFKLDAQGSKIKFPNADTPAKLGEYTYTAQRMAGTPTLTATLNHPMCLDDLWSGEEFVEFRGEKYYVDQTPTSSKDNKSVLYKHELQFVSERIVLENVYFMDVVTAGADTYHSNSTSVKFMGDINEFVGRLNASMTKSGIDYSVVIDDDIASDSKLVSLDNVYLAEALQSIYTIYELPYYFVGKVCHIGYTENVISTPFEYRKGLVSIKKTNANYKIVNRVTGVGSSDNIPFYYPNDDETGNIDQCQNLMPSIYRESGGAERYYNALDNTYKIPGTDDYYSFKNQYSPHKVKEFKVDFSDIKPTIEGVINASGQLFGEIADIAFDENDSDELGTGEGNNVFNGTDEYVHSYFYIKLHIYNGDYGFNLFEQGLEGGTAVINMTTGNCAACAFEIGVTYKDSEPQRAFNPVLVDSSGNLPAGDFEQKVTSQTSQYVERQQNTSTNSVWIAVKKDNTTFGVVMPNATNNYKPSIGDKFVITGIKMPKSLVLAAEKRLDEALIKYMSENNDEKFTFSVNFSRVFLADNIYLWDMLNENARIYIKYNNREYLMYVNSFTCKADKNCLYDISVELTDKLSANVSALRSTITEIAGDIIGNIQGGGYGGDILAKTSKHYIRKDQPDSAKYLVKFFKGIHTGLYTPEESGGMIDEEGNAELKKMSLRSGLDSNGPVTTDEVVSKNFTSGLLGVGHRLWNGVLEISELIVRKTMHVFEIIVQKVTSVNGSMLTTPGGGVRISEVEELEDGYKCLFNNDDGTIPNPFVVGDQALHQVFTGKNIGRYWRLVTEVGDNYFVLSKTDCEAGSGIPQVEDEIIQFGNRTDKNRQNAVLTTSYGSDAPYTAYYSNVNSYSLEGKEDVREGNLRGINDPDFGQLQGSGFYGKNVYLKGIFRLLSGKTVEESIGDVQSNLDNLQVGETNLLDNSNKGWKTDSYLTATIYLGDYKPKVGEQCTIVLKGVLGTGKERFEVYNSGGSGTMAHIRRVDFNEDNIASVTFNWNIANTINEYIRLYAYPSSIYVESEIEWVKLVLGNKTSLLWTPSINDQRQIAIDEAGKVVDGIQIGGVNILKGSTTGILWDFSTHNGTEFSRTGTSTAENSYIYSDYIILKGDTEIVLSFYAKHVGVLNNFDLYILPDDFNTYGLIAKGYQSGEDWVYNVLKLKTPSKWGDGKRVRLRIDHNGSPDGSSATIYVKDVQIEYGNKATTYSVPESDRKEIAKQQGLEGGQEAVNGLQIGSQNLISKKMMLKWNEKNKNIAVWGQDADGVYLRINEALLHKNWAGSNEIANPVFDLQFKPDTQYVLSVEWKLAAVQNYDGLAFRIFYTDGTAEWHGLAGTIITKTIARLITKAGKTVQKISASYGSSKANTLIYNISLIEGNKPLQGFPVAEEDQVGANNVNLAEGTKGPFTVEGGTNTYAYKALYIPVIKPNTVYYVNAQNIEFLSGNISKCDFILFDKSIKSYLTTTYHHLYDKNGGIIITRSDFEAQEGYLLCYAGEAAHTEGNSVRFTEVMIVEGFLPAPVWAPSFAEQQAGIDAANSAAKLAQQTAENAQITATEATTKLNNWASDSLISPPEKPAMRQQQADIQAEYKEIKANVEKYSLTDNAAWINYNNAYSLANTALTKYTASSPENITISSDYSNIAAYYPKRQEILNVISSAAIDAAKEYTTLKTYRETEIDLRAEKWDQDTYYPVTIKLPINETRIEVTTELGDAKPKWSTHNGGFSMQCVWRSNGSGWGANVVNRIIEVFEYRFTKEIPDTTPVQYILPAGSIGQLTSSSEELIYLRGGGRYIFRIGNNCVAVVHDSRYTAPDGSSVAPAASVIRPVPDLEALDYLKIALKEETTIEGGLISTSLIKVGAKQNGVNWNERAGICGIGDTDNSIRFYAGGDLDSAIRRVSGGDGTKANFVVTQAGRLFASDAIIEGNITVKNLTTASGKVVITESGQLVASDAEIHGRIIATSGEFTGKITATEGEIAGLKLSNNGLRSSDFNASSKIGSCYAKNGFSVYASGSGVLKPSTGGMQAGIITAVGDFISHITGLEIIAKETSYNSGSSSKVTALRIQAENRYYGTPFDPPLAIEVVSGDVLFGGKMTVNNTSIFRGQIYLNLNNIPNISGASNYYLCINRSTGQLSYR